MCFFHVLKRDIVDCLSMIDMSKWNIPFYKWIITALLSRGYIQKCLAEARHKECVCGEIILLL
jgi:hypothetical protein